MARRKIRYAIVGLGHISQNAILPSFKNASDVCELTAFISDDQEKIKKLSAEYGVTKSWTYDEYDKALASKEFDAVYITLPNDMHKDYVIRAAKAGVHILCEKPMAVYETDCKEMIAAAEAANVKLMIAYRLHFEKTNMQAVDLIAEGMIGTPRVFNSSFSMQVREGDIRTQREHGGGPLNDIGIYCINAARYIFRAEPTEVVALSAASDDPRFNEVEETFGAVLKFPGERIATFVCSFGATDISRYEVVGTKGTVVLDPAYSYDEELKIKLIRDGKEQEVQTPKRDQFAPELIHLAECILEDKQPRPSGYEGLNDLRVIEALRLAVETGESVKLIPIAPASKPGPELVIEKPLISNPPLVNVDPPSK